MFRTIRSQILSVVALCWLLPILVLGIYMGTSLSPALRKETETAMISSAVHAQSETIRSIDALITLAKSVTYDGVLESVALSFAGGEVSMDESLRISRNYLDQKFSRDERLTSAAFWLCDKPETVVTTSGYAAAQETTLLLSMVQARILALGETLDTRCRFISQDSHVYLVRNLYNKRLNRFGMLVLGVRGELLPAAFLSETSPWKQQVELWLDEFAWGSTARFPGITGLYEDEASLIYADQTIGADYTLSYRVLVSKTQVYAKIRQYYFLIGALLIALLAIEALFMVSVHHRLTRPLARISGASERISRGEWGVTVPVGGTVEIAQLSRAFNTMSLRTQELIVKSYQEEISLRDARIEALQNRINPHFLNNALEMINWQSRMEGSETISSMIDALSVLLNAALDRSDSRVVPLRSELAVAEAYFYFLALRFGDRLKVEQAIDPALLERDVPRLILQTMLENAVEHGIGRSNGGIIRLSVYQNREGFVLEVANNGKPLGKEDQARIERLLSDELPPSGGHLGIRNIHQRLKLIYGEEAGLMIESGADGQTVARAIIPQAQ